MWHLLACLCLIAVAGAQDDSIKVDFRDLRLKKRTASACSGVVDTCVICDTTCVERTAEAGFANPDDYIIKLLGKVSMLFLENGINIGFRLKERLLSDSRVNLSKFMRVGATPGEATGKLWSSLEFSTTLKDKGCELGFYLSASDDDLWSEFGTMGAASLCGICGKYSYAAVQMAKTSGSPYARQTQFDYSIVRTMHEFGHLFCMSHDRNAADPGYAKEPYIKYSKNLMSKCKDGDSGCFDPCGSCFMESVGAHGMFPRQFSDCSLAGLEFWCAISTAGQPYYSNACVKPVDQDSNDWKTSDEKGYMEDKNYSPTVIVSSGDADAT